METEAASLKEGAASQSQVQGVGRIVGSAAGLGLGWYAGFTLLLPLGLSLLLGLIISKTLPSRKVFLAPAAIIGGHVAWMILGMILTGLWMEVGLDIALLGAGLVWLLSRPGLGAVIFLGVCHAIELAYGGYLLGSTAAGAPQYKAIVVHFALYATSLTLLLICFSRHRKEKKQELHKAAQTSLRGVTPAVFEPRRNKSTADLS